MPSERVCPRVRDSICREHLQRFFMQSYISEMLLQSYNSEMLQLVLPQQVATRLSRLRDAAAVGDVLQQQADALQQWATHCSSRPTHCSSRPTRCSSGPNGGSPWPTECCHAAPWTPAQQSTCIETGFKSVRQMRGRGVLGVGCVGGGAVAMRGGGSGVAKLRLKHTGSWRGTHCHTSAGVDMNARRRAAEKMGGECGG